MRAVLSFVILSTFLTACNENQSHYSCDKSNNHAGNGIAPFKLTQIKNSSDPTQPNSLILVWDGEAKGIEYSACLFDASMPNNCHVLGLPVKDTNQTSVLLDSLIQQFNKPIFILAKKNDIIQKSANEQSISANVLNKLIQYIKPFNTKENFKFGRSVLLSPDGNTLFVGAPGESATLNDTNNDAAPNSGAVYIFKFNGDKWQQTQYLKASNSKINNRFGHSLSLSKDGKTLAIGAMGDKENSILETKSGTVYLFHFNGVQWEEQNYIEAPNRDGDLFGYRVKLNSDGTLLAISAIKEDSSDINDPQDNTSTDSGAVYLYRFNNSWVLEKYFKASNIGKFDNFGISLSFNEQADKLAIGASGESSSNKTHINDDASHAGAVYIFDYKDNVWNQSHYLKSNNIGKNDQFGISVDFTDDGKTLAVGAFGEQSNSDFINKGQTDDSATDAGAVYIFKETNNIWKQSAYIKASNSYIGHHFGFSIDINPQGTLLAVGAPGEDSNSQGFENIQNSEMKYSSGATYLFSYDGTNWKQDAYLKAPNSELMDKFGTDVSINTKGTTLAVGSELEDSIATQINGDQTNNLRPESGAVYVF